MSSRLVRIIVGFLALPLLLACTPQDDSADADLTAPQPSPVEALHLTDGWNVIQPEGDTTCSDGSPYHFYVRPGNTQQILFYLQGGGACWNGLTCDTHIEPSYRINLAEYDPASRHGIFAFDQAENPFAEHTMILAPYCTGDVHLGDSEATYSTPKVEGHAAHDLTIQYRGLDNVQAVLDWTQKHLRNPASIFVTGSSAGSIPSPYYAMRLAEAYPAARIAQLGDGSGGYRGLGESTPHSEWGTLEALADVPQFAEYNDEDFNFVSIFEVAQARQPNIQYAQYDTAEDDVQRFFLGLSGIEAASLQDLLVANQDDIRASAPGFRSYIAGGELHTILLRPEFYTYRVGDVRLLDWVSDLAAGEPVDDVQCEDCAVAETVPEADAATAQ